MKKLCSLKSCLIIGLVVIFALYFVAGEKQPEEVNTVVPELSGNTADLVSFSINPGDSISGEVVFQGSVKNGYFFEGNVLINMLDTDMNPLLNSYAMATTDWMTIEAVGFEGALNVADLPKGEAYIEIREDDPSDGEAGEPGSILIPVVIE